MRAMSKSSRPPFMMFKQATFEVFLDAATIYKDAYVIDNNALLGNPMSLKDTPAIWG